MVKERLQDTETKCMMMQGQLDSLQSKLADFERIEKVFLCFHLGKRLCSTVEDV